MKDKLTDELLENIEFDPERDLLHKVIVEILVTKKITDTNPEIPKSEILDRIVGPVTSMDLRPLGKRMVVVFAITTAICLLARYLIELPGIRLRGPMLTLLTGGVRDTPSLQNHRPHRR